MNRRTFVKLTGFGLFSGTAVAATLPPPRPSGGVRWGLEGLDANTSLQPGEIGVVMGLASSGKTTLLTNAVKHTLMNYDGHCSYFDSDSDAAVGRQLNTPFLERTYVSSGTCTLPALIEKMKKRGDFTRLLVCDSLTGYPTDSFASLEERLVELRQVAVDLSVPLLVSLQTNRMPKQYSPDAIVTNEVPFAWMRPLDLAFVCRKVRVRKRNDQTGKLMSAIDIDVLKNRHGKYGVTFTHELLSSAKLAPQPEE